VGIARALAPPPRLTLADEPTGALLREDEAHVLGLLDGFHRAGRTVVVVPVEPRRLPVRRGVGGGQAR
jgi:ABC-type ATPase involved in cell division